MAPASNGLTTLQLNAAWQQKIYTKTGRQVPFGSLFQQQPVHGSQAKKQQALVVFIRHFFCGYCQEYLRHLAEIMDPANLPESLTVAIIGCGAYTLIDSYRKVIRCPDDWTIYSDPTTKLYDQLGMHRSLSLGSKSPAYVQHSMALGMLKSALQGMKRIGHGDVRAAGDWSVQGGEFLFHCQAGIEQEWTLEWCHRMRNSRDHTEVEQLRDIIALDELFEWPRTDALGPLKQFAALYIIAKRQDCCKGWASRSIDEFAEQPDITGNLANHVC